MLSKKYLFIKKCMKKVSKVDFFHQRLLAFSQMYLDIEKGFRFSYLSEENGEEEFLSALANHYNKKTFLYFDVGAHIGTYTDMIIERSTNYEGHLFDVTKDTFEKCLERHGDNNSLKINNMALSNETGEIEYRYYPADPTRNGISGVGTEGNFEFELHKAPCSTGDIYCKDNNINHIDLLKIDAEGYDLHVIKGFEQMLSNGNIDIVQFEYNVKHSETHSMLGDYHKFLEEKGYIVGVIRKNGVDFYDFDFTHNGFENGPNYIACRPELKKLLEKFSPENGISKVHTKVNAIREKLGYWGKDKSAPRYSVCVSNYNMQDTIERAMTSVLKQLDEKLYEVVVIDDGSTDNSIDELEKLSKKYSNFRYIPLTRDKKRKLGETRNISIRAARGEYALLHIDADDEWEPYLQDLVTLFHKLEDAVGHDFMLAGQQTGIAKRNFLLERGGYENVYRSEDRNLMMKLAKNNELFFLDYKVYRTRLTRPVKTKIIKTLWDDCSQLAYDLRQNEPKWSYIKHALTMPLMGKRFSIISRFFRPIAVLPIFIATRFMPPIINPISREEMRKYHEEHRGTYQEVMSRLGANDNISFLSKEAQEIYLYSVKSPGFRR